MLRLLFESCIARVRIVFHCNSRPLECIGGKQPYDWLSSTATALRRRDQYGITPLEAAAIDGRAVEWPTDSRDETFTAVFAVMKRCLSVTPDARPTARELLSQIDRIRADLLGRQTRPSASAVSAAGQVCDDDLDPCLCELPRGGRVGDFGLSRVG